MNLALLFALILPNGGTPHFATLTWPAVTVTDSNDDGTTFTRPALGYNVYRAEVSGGVQSLWLLLNPDVPVIGMLDADGNPADGDFIDEQAVEGMSYVYTVSAVDFGGESAASPVSALRVTPINPGAPNNLQMVVH